MVRRSFRRGLRLGLLAGIVFAVSKLVRNWRAVEEPSANAPTPAPWPPAQRAPEPASGRSTAVTPVKRPDAAAPAAPAAAPAAPAPKKAAPAKKASKATAKKPTAPATPAPERMWVEPSGDVCPPEHPVKAKLSSKLFHLPGMFAYDRCKPDRCYLSAEAAESDGLTRAKR